MAKIKVVSPLQPSVDNAFVSFLLLLFLFFYFFPEFSSQSTSLLFLSLEKHNQSHFSLALDQNRLSFSLSLLSLLRSSNSRLPFSWVDEIEADLGQDSPELCCVLFSLRSEDLEFEKRNPSSSLVLSGDLDLTVDGFVRYARPLGLHQRHSELPEQRAREAQSR